MSTDSELAEMNREWRAAIVKKLDYLTLKIDEIPSLFAQQSELKIIKEKVENLQSFRNKSIGAIILFQFALSIAVYFIKFH